MKYNAFNPLLITWKYNGVFEAIITMYYVLRARVKNELYEKNSARAGRDELRVYCYKILKMHVKFYTIIWRCAQITNNKKLNKNVLKRQIN